MFFLRSSLIRIVEIAKEMSVGSCRICCLGFGFLYCLVHCGFRGVKCSSDDPLCNATSKVRQVFLEHLFYSFPYIVPPWFCALFIAIDAFWAILVRTFTINVLFLSTFTAAFYLFIWALWHDVGIGITVHALRNRGINQTLWCYFCLSHSRGLES